VTKTLTVTVPGTVPITAASGAAASASTAIRRTPDGKPDFSGVYGWGNLFGGGRGGAAPALKPGAEKYRVQRGPLDTGATSDCLPLIPPNSFGVPYEFQFIQSKDYLVILHEYPNTFRIVPLDGEPHQADPDPSWLGDSVGRWDGDTLVIDTIGFNDVSWLDARGTPHSTEMRIEERLRRRDYGHLVQTITITDPRTFTKPITITAVAELMPDTDLLEHYCLENEQDDKRMPGRR
jgi:hypothetical protein